MKRNYSMLILVIVMSVSTCGQIPKGFDGVAIDVNDLPDNVELSDIRGELIRNGYSFYLYAYDVTTMGVIESLDKLMDILEVNGRGEIETVLPDQDDSQYPSYYKTGEDGDADHELIATFCKLRDGKISKCWYINDEWGVIWQIDDLYAQVVAIKWED